MKDIADFCSTEYKSVLKHCETRWLSLARSIKRTLEMWEPLCAYFSSHPDVEKPGKVKTSAGLLSQPITKAWLLFLSNVLPIFDKFNVFFQTSSTATIHKLHGESERLLTMVFSFFIKADVLLVAQDVTQVTYMDCTCQLSHRDIFVGDDTSALLLHLLDEGEDVQAFYSSVLQFYEAFVKKQLKAFDFKSEIFHSLAFLDPSKSQGMPPAATFSHIEKYLSVSFNKSAVSLEFREFAVDSEVTDARGTNALTFWTNVSKMKSPMGELKYTKLATLALYLLAIPTSNADSERVFSLVRRIKTDFRASLAPETLSSLIGCHFNNTANCCKITGDIDNTLLKKAKTCTMERNLCYGSK